MKRIALVLVCALAGCGPPENDRNLREAFGSSGLKDPGSVQFQKTTKNPSVICGEFNSKNSYGAYTGFKVFVFQREAKHLWLENSDEASDNYQQFLDAMDACDNHIDLLIGITNRHSAEIRERVRASRP